MKENQQRLLALFSAQPGLSAKIEGDCLRLTNTDGLEAFVAAGEQQVVMETLLFPAASVTDAAKLNDRILKTHQLMPLTAVYISNISGEDYYVAFGALSVDSSDQDMLTEINALFSNVPEFIDLYSDLISSPTQAA